MASAVQRVTRLQACQVMRCASAVQQEEMRSDAYPARNPARWGLHPPKHTPPAPALTTNDALDPSSDWQGCGGCICWHEGLRMGAPGRRLDRVSLLYRPAPFFPPGRAGLRPRSPPTQPIRPALLHIRCPTALRRSSPVGAPPGGNCATKAGGLNCLPHPPAPHSLKATASPPTHSHHPETGWPSEQIGGVQQ
jgi:hypothetical protein